MGGYLDTTAAVSLDGWRARAELGTTRGRGVVRLRRTEGAVGLTYHCDDGPLGAGSLVGLRGG